MNTTARFEIVEALSPADVATARGLMIEYRDSISTPLCFQGFDAEMATLPGRYAPPTGIILLAIEAASGSPAGCIALREIDAAPFGRVCEMKRLYVAPGFRKFGLGRLLAEMLLIRAGNLGYAAMRLDTDADMLPAQRLYESLGFRPTAKYNNDPIPGTLFYEIRLDGAASVTQRHPGQALSRED